MSYRVALDVFEGPFDLLLQLISARKLDIYEVDLAQLTADFLGHLTGLDELDLDTATRFLVVAATLIELKAVRLLPKEDQDELEDLLGEARDLLYARLLEYRAFRDASRTLSALFDANQDFHPRDVPLEPRYRRLVPDTPLTIDPEGLAGLAAVALAPRPERHVDLSHVREPYLTIRDAALQILGRLPRIGASTSLSALVANRPRADQVAVFLALLELYKLGHLGLEQAEPFGEVAIERARAGLPVGITMLGRDVDHPEVDAAGGEPTDGPDAEAAPPPDVVPAHTAVDARHHPSDARHHPSDARRRPSDARRRPER